MSMSALESTNSSMESTSLLMDASIGGMGWALLPLIFIITVMLMLSQGCFWSDVFRHRGRLPRGSYGWPLLGESLALLSSGPRKFAESRAAKYGKVFVTHVSGDPTIVITCPDISRALYSMSSADVKLTSPPSSARLLGKRVFGFLESQDHDSVHKVVQTFFFPQSIEPHIPDMEKVILDGLHLWDGNTVNIFRDSRKLAANVVIRLLVGFSLEHDHLYGEIVELFETFYKGIRSLPIKLPGATYYKGMHARKKIAEILQYLIEKREASPGPVLNQNSLLKLLVDHRHSSNGEHMSQSEIIDNVITILFAGFDTTASTFSLTLKHLSENLEILEYVKAEQETIAERKRPGEPLTLKDLKDMDYTLQVLTETLRLPGPVPFSYREAIKDVEIGGYTIPKGWKIVNVFAETHQNPTFFSNPTIFDPSRFGQPGATKSKGFTPFGGGRHICPAREFAKINMKIILHHFFTKFRWLPRESNALMHADMPMDITFCLAKRHYYKERWNPVSMQQGFDHSPLLITSPKGGFDVKVDKITDQSYRWSPTN